MSEIKRQIYNQKKHSRANHAVLKHDLNKIARNLGYEGCDFSNLMDVTSTQRNYDNFMDVFTHYIANLESEIVDGQDKEPKKTHWLRTPKQEIVTFDEAKGISDLIQSCVFPVREDLRAELFGGERTKRLGFDYFFNPGYEVQLQDGMNDLFSRMDQPLSDAQKDILFDAAYSTQFLKTRKGGIKDYIVCEWIQPRIRLDKNIVCFKVESKWYVGNEKAQQKLNELYDVNSMWSHLYGEEERSAQIEDHNMNLACANDGKATWLTYKRLGKDFTSQKIESGDANITLDSWYFGGGESPFIEGGLEHVRKFLDINGMNIKVVGGYVHNGTY